MRCVRVYLVSAYSISVSCIAGMRNKAVQPTSKEGGKNNNTPPSPPTEARLVYVYTKKAANIIHGMWHKLHITLAWENIMHCIYQHSVLRPIRKQIVFINRTVRTVLP